MRVKAKLGTKIFLGYLTLLFFIVAVGYLGVSGMNKTKATYDGVVNINMPTYVAVMELEKDMKGLQAAIRAYMLYQDEARLNNYFKASEAYDKTADKLLGLVQTDTSRATIGKFKELKNSYHKECLVIIDFIKAGNMEAALKHAGVAVPVVQEYEAQSAEYQKFVDEYIGGRVAEAHETVETAVAFTYILSGMAFVVGIAISLIVTWGITKPIKDFHQVAIEVAEGDLRATIDSVKSGDEIEDLVNSFNKMVENLKALISNIQSSSMMVASTSEQLSFTAEGAAQATQEVAKSMEQRLMAKTTRWSMSLIHYG